MLWLLSPYFYYYWLAFSSNSGKHVPDILLTFHIVVQYSSSIIFQDYLHKLHKMAITVLCMFWKFCPFCILPSQALPSIHVTTREINMRKEPTALESEVDRWMDRRREWKEKFPWGNETSFMCFSPFFCSSLYSILCFLPVAIPKQNWTLHGVAYTNIHS